MFQKNGGATGERDRKGLISWLERADKREKTNYYNSN